MHVLNCLSIRKLVTHVPILSFQSVLLLYTPLICSPNPPQIPLTQAEMISDPLLLSLGGYNAQQLCSTSSISEHIHHTNKRWSERRAMFVKCLFAYSLLLFSIFNLHFFIQTSAFSWVKTPTEMQVQLEHRNWGVGVILWNCDDRNPSVLDIHRSSSVFQQEALKLYYALLLLHYSLLSSNIRSLKLTFSWVMLFCLLVDLSLVQ